MPRLACRQRANPRGRHFGRHGLAVVAEAQDIMQFELADAEEANSVTHCVTGEAISAQPRIGEGDAQRRVVSAQSGPVGRRRVLDLKQRPEMPSALALQSLDLKLESLELRERTGLKIARHDIDNIANLVTSLVFHEILQLARQIDCHLPKLYARGKRANSNFGKNSGPNLGWSRLSFAAFAVSLGP
jgi:hypothetical protein